MKNIIYFINNLICNIKFYLINKFYNVIVSYTYDKLK